jgi:photosystem II stability/assembly factor-like uncharacterized protein
VRGASQSTGVLSDLHALQAVNASVLYTAGDADVILKSTDGGSTWAALSSPTLGMRMLSLHFLDANTVRASESFLPMDNIDAPSPSC